MSKLNRHHKGPYVGEAFSNLSKAVQALSGTSNAANAVSQQSIIFKSMSTWLIPHSLR